MKFTIVSTPEELSKIKETIPTLEGLTLDCLSLNVDEGKISELDDRISQELKTKLSERISRKDDISLRLFRELARSEGYVSWEGFKRNPSIIRDEEQLYVFFYHPRAKSIEEKNRIIDCLKNEYNELEEKKSKSLSSYNTVPLIHSKVPEDLLVTNRLIFGLNSLKGIDLDDFNLKFKTKQLIDQLNSKDIPIPPVLDKRHEDLQKKESLSKFSEPQVSSRKPAGTPARSNSPSASNNSNLRQGKKGCSIS
mgnify:CR=1 FL=1